MGWYLNGTVDQACGLPEDNLLIVAKTLSDPEGPWQLPLHVAVSCIRNDNSRAQPVAEGGMARASRRSQRYGATTVL